MLWNSLIQPHFNYACVSYYSLVSKQRKKIQVTQNKCIRFCLKLNSRHHIGANELKDINWLPIKKIVKRVTTNIFKYWKETSPFFAKLTVCSLQKYMIHKTAIICKKHWKNCASSENAVSTSKTLTEYTMRSCITIASNNCRLLDLRLTEFRWIKMKSSNYSLVPISLAKN